MKAEARIFAVVSGFLFLAAAIYGWWTWADGGGSSGGSSGGVTGAGVEFIGVVALVLAGLLCLMIGGYFWFVSRRIDPRPEDRPDGEIADGAGDVGFFSPGSYWPFGAGLATLVVALGMAFAKPWLLIVGLVAVLLATSGLLFEYYTGTRRTAGH